MGKIRLVPWTLLAVQPEIYIFALKKRESLSSHYALRNVIQSFLFIPLKSS